MTAIQALLILAIGFLLVIYYKSLKYQAIKRLLFLFLFALGMVLVVFPDLTNRCAHILGIGRGADLLLYFGIIGGFLVLILIYSKFKEMERQIAEITRSQAIMQAKTPSESTLREPKDHPAGG